MEILLSSIPDGRSVLFDRFRPQGGDIWMMDGLTE
jgi:Tol biopolymer transport system component